MARFLKSREKNLGKAPGDQTFIGNKKIETPRIRIIHYSANTISELETVDPQDCSSFLDSPGFTWISVYGLHDTDVVEQICNLFQVHPLVRDDIVNTGQRPKVEEHDDYIYLVLKMMIFDETAERVRADQVSLLVGDMTLISFHERPVEFFHQVRERLRKGKGRIRTNGPDYLAYTLVDVIVDNYLVAIEHIGSKIEDTEEAVLTRPDQEVLSQITRYKREINYMRKTIRPARELIVQLTKVDSELIQEQNLPFWKDLAGLATQATEVLETYREMLSDHLNTYNTAVSNRMNEIMKVLTIFAAIFIPLTFIAGIYGTNFEYVPELHFKYSYYVFWAVMIGVAALMIRYFRKKGWL